MTHFGKLLVAALGALSLVAVGSATVLAHDGHGDTHSILEFSSMTPVAGAAVSGQVRGVPAPSRAWVITSGSGEVDRNGHVHVSVTGLILAAAPNNNPQGPFKVIVSCVTRHHVIANIVSAGTFPATMTGDSTIDTTLALPRHCKDPILFVTSGGGLWFAMSNPRGHDEDDD